jgi:hypothetical protein
VDARLKFIRVTSQFRSSPFDTKDAFGPGDRVPAELYRPRTGILKRDSRH